MTDAAHDPVRGADEVPVPAPTTAEPPPEVEKSAEAARAARPWAKRRLVPERRRVVVPAVASVLAHAGTLGLLGAVVLAVPRAGRPEHAAQPLHVALEVARAPVWDLLLRYTTERVDLFVRVDNLFDKRWRETQFFSESQLQGEAAPAEDIHFTPGNPVGVEGGVRLKF